jgi:predicted esterase
MVAKFFFYFRLLSLLLALIGGFLSIALLTVGESQEAQVFAIGALIFSLGPLAGWLAHAWQSRFLSVLTVFGLIVWLGITGWLLLRAPNGRASDPATARVQNRYLNDDWHYPRAALGNMFPELDQFRLGFKVVPALDPLLTTEQARNLAQLTTTLYHDLEADPDFHALGSVMPHAYEDLVMGRPDRGHYFLYIPQNLDRKKPAPALVFLHGSGGNFKAYTWLLSKIADDLQMVLIAPTFGMGKWHEPATSKLVYAAIQDATEVVAIDRNQRHLIGLSNGGLGVCQAGGAIGRSFQSMIFISPVMDFKAMDAIKFMDRWKNRPVLIITGAADDRVPLESVNKAAAILRSHSTLVTLETIPQGDHFILFTHRPQVLQKITDWLKSPPTPPPPPAPAAQ